MEKITNILLSGVGGQGIILSSNIISDLLFEEGFEVLKNEIHGMSQRGGDVCSHIRFGKEVYSPTIELGTADYIVGFEWLEALRMYPYLRKGGVCIINDTVIEPAPVKAGIVAYPPAEKIKEVFSGITDRLVISDAATIVKDLGNPRGVNIFLIGILSKYMESIPHHKWIDSIRKNVKPEFIEKNIQCFDAGRSA
jgi:indolepyruvate ferredoxin oxidoreductase, beta subunit